MKELKTYISEGFFSNVGANNRIKLAIDTIKDASINDKINSRERKPELIDSLTSILKNIEIPIMNFETIRNEKIREYGKENEKSKRWNEEDDERHKYE